MRLFAFALLVYVLTPAIYAQTAAGSIYYSGGSLPSAASMSGKTIFVKNSDATGAAGSGTYVLTSNGTSWSGVAMGGGTAAPSAGMVKSTGSALAPATDGTDYLSPSTGVTSVNGVSGSVTVVTAPATGLVKSNGSALQTATPGTDYLSPATGVKSLNGQVGTLTISSGLVKSTGVAAALTNAVDGTDFLSPSTGVKSLNGQTGTLTVGSGLVKSIGTGLALTTATAGTDYLTPSTGVTSVNGSTGAVTTVTAPAAGLVKSSGSALQTAVAGTDYMTPSTAVTTSQLPAIAKGRTCEIHIWGSGTAGALTTTTDSEPFSCLNDTASTYTITNVKCLADNSSTTTTVTPIVQGGTSTSIVTGALTCGSGTYAAGTLNGTPTLASGASINAQVTAGGTANSVRLIITGTY